MTIDDAIAELDANVKGVKFNRLVRICGEFFEAKAIKGSHHRFKTPWQGDPRINLQRDGDQAKPYQVRQVIESLRRLSEVKNAGKGI